MKLHERRRSLTKRHKESWIIHTRMELSTEKQGLSTNFMLSEEDGASLPLNRESLGCRANHGALRRPH